jgi:hypothetical protein
MRWSVAVLIVVAMLAPVPARAQVPRSEVELLREEIRKLQERLDRLERGVQPPPAATPPAAAPPVVQAPAPEPRPGEREISLDREHPFEVIGLPKPEIAGFRFGGFFVGSASYNSHIQMVPEFAGGAPALADAGSVNFRFDKFGFGVSKTFTSWLSAHASIEVERHRDRHSHGFDPAFGCPGGGPCVEQFGAEEPETEVDLDKFAITAVVPIGNGLSLSFGRVDVPFGIERHDEPLLLTATTSEVFRFGRPQMMTGFQSSYQFAPWLDVAAWVANRWETETTHEGLDDNNRDKSFGGRIGVTPLAAGEQLLNFGIGGFIGPERTGDSEHDRWVLDLDVTWTPFRRLLLAAEAIYGGESGVSFRERGRPFAAPAVTNEYAHWWGFYLLAHYDVLDWLGVSARYGFFDDEDGARTGVAQRLQSFTFTPVFHLSRLIPDLRPIGATYPRTRHPINWIDVKLEYRLNTSSKNVFSDLPPGRPITTADDMSHQLQLQFVVNY